MDTSIELLKNMLNGCSARHRVLANNLANAETPHFRRQDINFREALVDAINNRDSGQHDPVRFEVRQDKQSPRAANGNNVSIQKELGLIVQNNLLYNTATAALSSKLSRLKQAVRGP